MGGASSSPRPPGGVKLPGRARFPGSAQCGCGLAPQGVASRKRSGKPAVIPRQRRQPRVPADKRSALAGVLRAAGQPRGRCSSCQLPPVLTPHRGLVAPGRSSEGSPARSPEGMVPGVSGCTPPPASARAVLATSVPPPQDLHCPQPCSAVVLVNGNLKIKPHSLPRHARLPDPANEASAPHHSVRHCFLSTPGSAEHGCERRATA